MIPASSPARSVLLAATMLASLLPGAAARAQPVTGFYVGAGAGGNFMGDESISFTERVGAYRTSFRSPFFNTSSATPASSFGFHGREPFDAGGAAVLSAGYGFGNGLRVEVEGSYRINAFSFARGHEEKFGGMANVLYDLPLTLLGVTPYAGLGAGYMWADRGHVLDRTDSFAYQAILGGAIPVPPTWPAPNLLFFDWDRADLTDRARQIIAQAADQSRRIAVTRIEVSGHTDTSGTAGYNQGLSVRRAQTVAAELVRLGVPRGSITTQGFGFSRPLVATGPNAREPQNRRVEIVLR